MTTPREEEDARALDRARLAAIQTERAWLAQLLHDTVCQSHATLRLLAKVLERQATPAPAAPTELWAELNDRFTAATADLATVMDALGPTEIGPAGLLPALDELAETAAPDVCCSISAQGDFATLPPALAAGLYALAREIVHGTLRTARPGALTFTLELAAESLRGTITGAPEDGIRWDWAALQIRCLGGTWSREADGLEIYCPLRPEQPPG